MRFPFKFVYSGQHYDYELSQSFIRDLGLPEPDRELGVRAISPAALTGQIIIETAEVIRELDPALILVQGDTNTTLAATIAALKEGVHIGHVEAGLRSYDWRMPEEHNRRMIDHVSNFLYAPTRRALQNTIDEKAPGIKHLTGNTVIDAIIDNMPKAEVVSDISSRLHFDDFILATAHRAENVDNPKVLREFVDAFRNSPLPVVFPVHPRTVQCLRHLSLLDRLVSAGNVQLLPPIGYFDFLVLMKRSSLILTDSGGVQEEATAPPIRKRVVVMRNSTERPEAVESGFAMIAGTRSESILLCISQSLDSQERLPSISPFGDGESGALIAKLATNIVSSETRYEQAIPAPKPISIVTSTGD
jgi:UDP-N-acetylglucosamine 2-epimerase (non-hydrolysing)